MRLNCVIRVNDSPIIELLEKFVKKESLGYFIQVLFLSSCIELNY